MESAGVASLVLLAFTSESAAEMTLFKADLKGSNQVPPSQTRGTGTFSATYDSVTRRLSWKGRYSDLSGPASQGECRLNSDTKAPPLTSPFEGSATLTEAQAAELMAGMYYVNIHTNAYARGEIRGQLVQSQPSR